jgi:hypothetical protein
VHQGLLAMHSKIATNDENGIPQEMFDQGAGYPPDWRQAIHHALRALLEATHWRQVSLVRL